MIFSLRTLRRILCLVAALLICGALYFSPLYTVYRLHQALLNNDADVFSDQIDFPALRASLTESQAAVASTGDNQNHSHIFTEAGTAMVREQMIDAVVSPTAVQALMKVRALRQSANVTFANLRDQLAVTMNQHSGIAPSEEASIQAAVDKNSWHQWHLQYNGWFTAILSRDDADSVNPALLNLPNGGRAAAPGASDAFTDLLAGKSNALVLRRNFLFDWKVIAVK